jgi:hypothetical protein
VCIGVTNWPSSKSAGSTELPILLLLLLLLSLLRFLGGEGVIAVALMVVTAAEVEKVVVVRWIGLGDGVRT